jgi:hypothetical protein
MSPQSWEKLMSSGSFTNSVTLTALNAIIRRLKKKKHVAGTLISRSSQRL